MSDAVTEKVIATLASVKRIPADKITLETNLQELGIDFLDGLAQCRRRRA